MFYAHFTYPFFCFLEKPANFSFRLRRLAFSNGQYFYRRQ